MSRITSVRSITLTSSGLLEVARLGRAEVVVEDDDVGLVGLDQLLELLDLARADVGGDVDPLPLLEHLGHDDQAGRLGQAADLLQGIIGRILAVGQEDPDQDGLLPTVQTLGAFEFGQVYSRPRFERGGERR